MRAVADDIARTTGMRFDAEAGEDEHGPNITVRAGNSEWTHWGNDPRNAAALAGLAQEQWLIEELGRTWPRCLKHGCHPMLPRETTWCCSLDGDGLIEIGSLVEEGP